jgi:hypothetical protein
MIMLVFYGVVVLIGIASLWIIFQKAGKPGWASIVPIYNIIVLLEIIEKPIIWLLFLLIPLVGIIFSIMMVVELAKKFGKDTGFALGMIFLPFIFYPILAFGSAEYEGSSRMRRRKKKKKRRVSEEEEDELDLPMQGVVPQPMPMPAALPRNDGVIMLTCAGCSRLMRLKSELIGKRIKCPSCGAVQLVTAG